MKGLIMDKKYILIVFESNNVISDEDIYSAGGIKKRFCEIVTLTNMKNNQDKYKHYNYMLDCTFDNKFFNWNLNSKKGTIIKYNGFDYLKTATGKLILKGPNVSQLTVTRFSKSQSIMEKFEKDLADYNNKIDFLISQNKDLVNILNYEKGIKNGIDVTSFIHSTNKASRYLLVSELPEIKDESITYILPDNIKMLESFLKIAEYIK